MTEHTAAPGNERSAVTWKSMNARKESRWHAVVSSAVAGTVRGLALVVASSPTPGRLTRGQRQSVVKGTA